MRYRAYRTKKDNQFYFQFLTEDGTAVLNSQAYANKSDCFTGIRSVIDNADNPDRYEAIAGSTSGTFAFILKAGNHIEIARSVDYTTEAEATNMIALCQQEIPNAKSTTDQSSTKVETTKSSTMTSSTASTGSGKGSRRDDDYRPLAFYEARISGVENGFDQFFDEEGQEYYFTYNMNGQVILISEGYNAEAGRDKGIQSVTKNINNPDRYQHGIHKNGKYFFNLRAGNNQEIATSRWCDTADELNLTIQALTSGDSSLLMPAMTRSTSAPTVSGHRLDDYLDCDAYVGEVGFHRFEKDGKYYFGYNHTNGNTLLRSQGYTAEAGRDNGIESVKKNGPLETRWTMGEENGQWYYALKAGNHQEIARSCYYATENEMKSAFVDARYAFEEKPVPIVAATPLTGTSGEATSSQKIVDDYMPCEAYTGAAGFHSFYDENRKEYFFAYNDEDGNTLLRSEGYTTAAARDNGIESVKKNAPIDSRWKKETVLNGKYHYYVLRAGNNQEIARSCYYEDHEQMNTNFMLLGGAFATVGGGSMVSSMTSSSSSTVVKTTSAKKEKEDDYLPCQEYEGKTVNDKQNNVALFKHDNGQYYFALYRPDGSVRLRSEGFESAEARDQELSGVLKYANDKDMYTRIERGDYYIDVLKDKTGREVGRSCLQKVAAPVVLPKEKEDDYLKCSEYANRKVNDKVNNVALFKHENGQYYFAVYYEDGSVRLRSEGFETAKGRDEELSGALKNMDNPDMYETIQKGDYYINVLRDTTGREVARSCMKKERVAVIPPIITSGGAAGGVAGGIAAGLASGAMAGGGMAGHKESVSKEKVVVPPPVVKPVAPVAKDFVAPPPPPKKVDVVAATPIAPAAASGGGGFNWWWLLPLLLLLAALLFLLMRGCDGCNKPVPPTPTPPVIDTTAQVTPPAPPKTAICPAAGDLKLAEGSGSNIANYLSDPDATYPKRFTLNEVNFGKNNANITAAGRKALDDVAVCLQGCENTTVDIYGYISRSENSSYRGSKEVSLDDMRAKAVYEYLKKRGIADSRMSFQGEGTGDSGIVIQINEQ